jgi:hypothetical protein
VDIENKEMYIDILRHEQNEKLPKIENQQLASHSLQCSTRTSVGLCKDFLAKNNVAAL